MEGMVRDPLKIDGALSAKMANMSFWAAMLVVLMHAVGKDHVAVGSCVETFVHCVRNVFTFSAVPYFFLAAGFFLAGHFTENGWWRKELAKRVKTLLIPYLIWLAIGFVFVHDNLLVSLGLTFAPPKPTHIWFLRALIILVAASPIVAGVVRIRVVAMLCLSALLMASFCFEQNYFVPWLGIFSFVLGAFLRFNPVHLNERIFRPVVVMLLFAAVCLGVPGFPGERVILPLLSLTSFWILMPCKRMPKQIASMAFPIYLLHPFIYFVLFKAETMLGFKNYSGRYLSVHLLFFLIALTGSIGMGLMLKRSVPRIANLIFGGR